MEFQMLYSVAKAENDALQNQLSQTQKVSGLHPYTPRKKSPECWTMNDSQEKPCEQETELQEMNIEKALGKPEPQQTQNQATAKGKS